MASAHARATLEKVIAGSYNGPIKELD